MGRAVQSFRLDSEHAQLLADLASILQVTQAELLEEAIARLAEHYRGFPRVDASIKMLGAARDEVRAARAQGAGQGKGTPDSDGTGRQ